VEKNMPSIYNTKYLQIFANILPENTNQAIKYGIVAKSNQAVKYSSATKPSPNNQVRQSIFD
jgi:hypothetical protein